MQELGNSITQIFHEFYKGETGDDGKPMMKEQAQVYPITLWAYLTSLFRK